MASDFLKLREILPQKQEREKLEGERYWMIRNKLFQLGLHSMNWSKCINKRRAASAATVWVRDEEEPELLSGV